MKRVDEASKRNAVGRLASESPEAIAEELGVTTSTLRIWKRRYGQDSDAGGAPPSPASDAQLAQADRPSQDAAAAVEAVTGQQVDQLYPPLRLPPIDPRQARSKLKAFWVSTERRVQLLSDAEEKTLP